MAGLSQETTVLLTEHLQFTPLSLIDDIINAVNELVYQGIQSLESGLFNTSPERLGFTAAASSTAEEVDYPEAKQEIEEGLHKLETLLNSTVDKKFDIFELYVLRNILAIPEDLQGWIQLSHYEGVIHPTSSDAPTTESITILRRKTAASRKVTAALQAEKVRNEAILAQLRQLTAGTPTGPDATTPNLSFLTQTPSAQAFNISTSLATGQCQPLTTQTNFTLSQLPALRSLVSDLRTKVAELQATQAFKKDSKNTSAREEREQERRDYIEKRARLHIAKDDRGMEIDSQAHVGGKKVKREEVEALERVAGILGKG